MITGVVSRGLLVELSDSMQRGLIPLTALPHDWYEVDAKLGRVKGRHQREAFRVGTLVSVELMRVDEGRRLIDFKLLADRPITAAKQPVRKTSARKKRRSQRMR